MLSVSKLLVQGRGLSPVLLKRAATLELDWDVRQKSRFDATDSQGRALGIFLPRGSAVRGGDVLVAEDGSLIRVVATPQPVMVVRACAEHGSPFDLVRAAYHLGNRHVALQLAPDHLKLEPDHVLAAMLRRMHLIVTEEVEEPFDPESGAYAATDAAHDHDHGHGHGHADHDHDHAQAHAHEHGHDHAPRHDHGHASGPRHDHLQGHDHEHVHGGMVGNTDPLSHAQAHGETADPVDDAASSAPQSRRNPRP